MIKKFVNFLKAMLAMLLVIGMLLIGYVLITSPIFFGIVLVSSSVFVVLKIWTICAALLAALNGFYKEKKENAT